MNVISCTGHIKRYSSKILGRTIEADGKLYTHCCEALELDGLPKYERVSDEQLVKLHLRFIVDSIQNKANLYKKRHKKT
jgi:hypothetical protein